MTRYEPGDEVFGLLPFPQGHGAYSEFVVGPARVFAAKPLERDRIPCSGHLAVQIAKSGGVLVSTLPQSLPDVATRAAEKVAATFPLREQVGRSRPSPGPARRYSLWPTVCEAVRKPP